MLVENEMQSLYGPPVDWRDTDSEIDISFQVFIYSFQG